jgi:hypothetical protein
MPRLLCFVGDSKTTTSMLLLGTASRGLIRETRRRMRADVSACHEVHPAHGFEVSMVNVQSVPSLCNVVTGCHDGNADSAVGHLAQDARPPAVVNLIPSSVSRPQH